MVPSRETAMTGKHDAQGLIAFAKTPEEADDELDQYLRAYCGQPLDVMRHVQAIRGGSVEECLDWLARYVDAGATPDPADRLADRAPRICGRATIAGTEGDWIPMTGVPDAETMKVFNKSIVDEFRANDGKVGGPFEGATLLLLTTTGAKSGQPRLAPLAYLTINGKVIIIGSKAGADSNPDWVHNLRANPRAHVEVGTDAYDVTARELPPEERDETYPKVVAVAPGFGEYQAKTSRVIPLFELQRV